MSVTDSGSFHHTCFLVNDLEKAAKALADSLSVSWNVWTIEPESCTVHGQNVQFSFRVAMAPVGGSNYELITPLEGESVYVEHLTKKGEGFHHTCMVYATPEAARAARDELFKQGRTLIQSGRSGDLFEFYYFDIAETSAVLEILYLKELPPPEKTIG